MRDKLIEVEEFHRMIAVLHGRDRLIVEILGFTGLRVKELITLRRYDIDFSRRVIRIRADISKTGKARDVVIPAQILPSLEDYLNRLDGDVLFPVTTFRIRQIVRKAAEESGIQSAYATGKDGRNLLKVTPHSLRSFHAVYGLDCGIPINDMAAQLGHSSLKTTALYAQAGLNHRRTNYDKFRL